MTVEVELWAEDLLTGARELCTKGSFVLVAVDENRRPVPIQVTSRGPSEGAKPESFPHGIAEL